MLPVGYRGDTLPLIVGGFETPVPGGTEKVPVRDCELVVLLPEETPVDRG